MRRQRVFGATEGATAVTTDNHPLMRELAAALEQPEQAASTLAHLEECLACAVRFARLQRASGPVSASSNSVQRVIEASTLLPEALVRLVSADRQSDPQPDEIWRVGRSEAMLVWVRKIVDDGVADVVPLVLDVELADRESVIIGAEATPLEVELAAMVALRTHIHFGAFINRIGPLDIRKDVTEVMTAVREGRRPSGVHVGPPIEDDDDQRLEYRQALRDVFSELTPSAWDESQLEPDGECIQRTEALSGSGLPKTADDIKTELGERLLGLHWRTPDSAVMTVGEFEAQSILKVSYLQAAALIVLLKAEGLQDFPDPAELAIVCKALSVHEPDIGAVAIAIPRDGWPTQLFTTASMRTGLVAPSGMQVGPKPVIDELDMVDTLHKYFEGVTTVWEVTEPLSRHGLTVDYHEIATRHATEAASQVAAQGGRALQPAKKAAWQKLPDELAEQVANFVVALAGGEAPDQALTRFAPEVTDD